MAQTMKLIKNFLNITWLEVEQKGTDFAYDSASFCSCNDIEDYKGDEITFLLYLGKEISQGKGGDCACVTESYRISPLYTVQGGTELRTT